MTKDNRIKIVNLFKNNKNGKTTYNFSIEFSPDVEYKLWFQLTKMPMNSGNGYFYLWPQTVYDKERFANSNYKEGVNKHIFGNKAFGVAVQEACDEYLANEEGNVSHETNTTIIKADVVKADDINLEEIKF